MNYSYTKTINLKKDFNIPEGHTLICYQGVIQKGRGIAQLFSVIQQTNNLAACIIGDGEAKQYFALLAKKLNIETYAYKTHTCNPELNPNIIKVTQAFEKYAKIDLMKQALNDFYMQTSTKGNLTLFIHPSMRDAMERHAKSLSATLSVEEDERMSPVQARIEWTNGAFEFTPDLLMEQILQTLQGGLSENDQILDDNQKNPHTDEENRDKEQDL